MPKILFNCFRISKNNSKKNPLKFYFVKCAPEKKDNTFTGKLLLSHHAALWQKQMKKTKKTGQISVDDRKKWFEREVNNA